MRRKIYLAALFIYAVIILRAPVAYAQDRPRRVVSLGPSITDQLYLLGADDILIADTTYCKDPSDGRPIEKIGTVINANIEKIIALKPDLVLAISLTSRETELALQKLGIDVVKFPQPRSFEEICSQFLALGRMIGKGERAREIIGRVRNRVNELRDKVKGLPKARVFIQVGARPLFTATKDTFINDYIEFAGGNNIAKDAATGFYSREEVLRKNPDVIIIATMGIMGEEEKRIWNSFKTLNAAKEGRVFIVEPYGVCSPTPVTFTETLDEIEGLLHRHDERI